MECLALRDNTESPETITIGTNELIGTDPSKLSLALARLMAGQWKKGVIPPKWDGKAAERIVLCFEKMLGKRSGECDREDKTMTPDLFLSPQERGRRTEAG